VYVLAVCPSCLRASAMSFATTCRLAGVDVTMP